MAKRKKRERAESDRKTQGRYFLKDSECIECRFVMERRHRIVFYPVLHMVKKCSTVRMLCEECDVFRKYKE